MTTMTSLDDRLRRLEDLELIRTLLHTYRERLDRNDLTGLAALFTPDAEWRGGSMRAAGGPPGILAMLRERFTEGVPDDDWHVIANPLIELDGDTAHVRSTYLVVNRGLDGVPLLRLLGEYDDDVVRLPDGSWLFARRHARIEMPPIGLVS
jgi:hypothetical protein